MSEQNDALNLTADIVVSYVGNNSVASSDLPSLINDVHKALVTASKDEIEPEKPKPVISVRRSVTPDHVICLEDGMKFKSLKRHLRSHHDMTPSEYRERWDLPHDYPMVAPNYAAKRSELALKIGLGRKGKGRG